MRLVMTKQYKQSMKERSVRVSRFALLFVGIAGLAAVGCTGGKNNNTADNPGVAGGASSAQYHTYIGTQTVDWSNPRLIDNGFPFQYGGAWDIALDDSSKFFSYQNPV